MVWLANVLLTHLNKPIYRNIMKKIIIALAALIMICASCSVPQTAVMNEIRKIENIQSTHLPISLISSLSGLGNKVSSIPGLNLSALKNVNSIDIMQISEPSAKSKARKLLEQFYKGNTYELIFQSKQNMFQGISMYALPMPTGDYSNVVIINDNNSEIDIVELKGTMSSKDLKFLDI